VALMNARCLEVCRQGETAPRAWGTRSGLVLLALFGVGVAIGLAAAGGAFPLAALHGRKLPALQLWAVLGIQPVAGAGVASVCLRPQLRGRLIVVTDAATVLYTAGLCAGGTTALDASKAPRTLVVQHGLCQPDHEIRIACHQYFQPSLVFYCQREVERLDDETKALEFLDGALPAYLIVPDPVWEALHTKVRGPYRVLGRHRDLFRNCEVVVVTNQAG